MAFAARTPKTQHLMIHHLKGEAQNPISAPYSLIIQNEVLTSKFLQALQNQEKGNSIIYSATCSGLGGWRLLAVYISCERDLLIEF
jgi:hypothetical protein